MISIMSAGLLGVSMARLASFAKTRARLRLDLVPGFSDREAAIVRSQIEDPEGGLDPKPWVRDQRHKARDQVERACVCEDHRCVQAEGNEKALLDVHVIAPEIGQLDRRRCVAVARIPRAANCDCPGS